SSGCPLSCRALLRGFLRALLRSLLGRTTLTALRQQRGRSLQCEGGDVVVLPQGGVVLAIRHVVAEPTRAHGDRLARYRVRAELLERRSSCRTPSGLGLGIDRACLFQ